MEANKHQGQGATETEGGAMPSANPVRSLSWGNSARIGDVNMTTATLTASASLAAIATGAPVVAADVSEALAAFADTDSLLIASEAADAVRGMATVLSEADVSVSTFAKAYGRNRSVLQFARGFDSDSLNANEKRAIGFDELPATASAKRKLSQWQSRFRLISERRNRPADVEATDKRFVSDEQLAGLYSGTVSFLTVYDNLTAADRAHKAAAKKLAEAETAAETITATESAPPTISDAAMALAAMLESASDDERAAAGEAMALLLDVVNGIYNVETVETVETVEAAAA